MAGNVTTSMPTIPHFPEDREELIRDLIERGRTYLPGTLDMEVVKIGDGNAILRCPISEKHLALNGFLHAGSIISLADTAAGYGCIASRPEGAIGFTTLEIKSNHVSTLLEGAMVARATMIHGGRTTQVWDVVVSDEETERPLAYYRATQLILYPRD
jgi:uncharacterized protein (TIGR00369 family)